MEHLPYLHLFASSANKKRIPQPGLDGFVAPEAPTSGLSASLSASSVPTLAAAAALAGAAVFGARRGVTFFREPENGGSCRAVPPQRMEKNG